MKVNYFFVHLYPIVPTPLVKKMIFSPLNCLNRCSTIYRFTLSTSNCNCLVHYIYIPYPSAQISSYICLFLTLDISLWKYYLFKWMIFLPFRVVFKNASSSLFPFLVGGKGTGRRGWLCVSWVSLVTYTETDFWLT